MCALAYLAIELRADMRVGQDVLAPASSVAARHGLPLAAIDEPPWRDAFTEGADLVRPFAVNHCACDWRERERSAMFEIATELLQARDVRRVRVGVWLDGCEVVRGAVADQRGQREKSIALREVDTSELASVDRKGQLVLEVRRAPVPPFPTRTLSQLYPR